MSIPALTIQKQQAGTCPHGAPMGACPICRGMGGGGGGNDRDVRRRPGEMSWNECFAAGLILNQKRLAEARQAEQNAQALLALQNSALGLAVNRFAAFIGNVAGNLITNTLNTINRTLIQPALNSIRTMVNLIKENIQNLTQNVRQILQDIKQKLIDISDKLAAFFGEMKNAIEKNISDRFKRLTRRALSIFSFIDAEYTMEEEDERINEDKRFFELSQLKQKILQSQEIEKALQEV